MREVTSEHKQELTYLAAYKYKKTAQNLSS